MFHQRCLVLSRRRQFSEQKIGSWEILDADMMNHTCMHDRISLAQPIIGYSIHAARRSARASLHNMTIGPMLIISKSLDEAPASSARDKS
eukprot:6214266-Pleurochrysis_carterae.AAC.6